MIWEIISFILLFAPLVVELIDDANADQNKEIDVLIRVAIGLAVAAVAWLTTDHNFLLAFNLSMAIHWLLFDYAINVLLNRNLYEKRVPWFSHVGTSSVVDQIGFWKNMNQWARLGIRVLYFGISLTLYFVI